jgi:23S rRNA (adenine1618-N6)-methyltransferase
MHPRNRLQGRYNLRELSGKSPELSEYLFINQFGVETIDFSDAHAVKALNKALLLFHYGIKFWELPDEFLCPPIPGRADYIHAVSDLFKNKKNLHVLDVGVGANCIYPLIGLSEYNWTFVGSDVNKKAIKNAQNIIDKNKLKNKIELRLQKDKTKIFSFIMRPGENFDLTICNPPFHESEKAASEGTMRKWRNLGKSPEKGLNFGGQKSELWYPGGEKAFIGKMIRESVLFSKEVKYFTTLVSKDDHLTSLLKQLKLLKAETQILPMEHGNKKSRVLCWSFKI